MQKFIFIIHYDIHRLVFNKKRWN